MVLCTSWAEAVVVLDTVAWLLVVWCQVVLAFDTRFWGSKTSVIGVASDDVYSFPW